MECHHCKRQAPRSLEQAESVAEKQLGAGSIAPLDACGPKEAAVLAAERKAKGDVPIDLRDTLIAGIALAVAPSWPPATPRPTQRHRIGLINPFPIEQPESDPQYRNQASFDP